VMIRPPSSSILALSSSRPSMDQRWDEDSAVMAGVGTVRRKRVRSSMVPQGERWGKVAAGFVAPGGRIEAPNGTTRSRVDPLGNVTAGPATAELPPAWTAPSGPAA
jgi:hypothetical protein